MWNLGCPPVTIKFNSGRRGWPSPTNGKRWNSRSRNRTMRSTDWKTHRRWKTLGWDTRLTLEQICLISIWLKHPAPWLWHIFEERAWRNECNVWTCIHANKFEFLFEKSLAGRSCHSRQCEGDTTETRGKKMLRKSWWSNDRFPGRLDERVEGQGPEAQREPVRDDDHWACDHLNEGRCRIWW